MPEPAALPRRGYRRRLGNYLLNRSLQLRYVTFVTAISALISASLGFLIWRQEHRATANMLAARDSIAQPRKQQVEELRAAIDEVQRRPASTAEEQLRLQEMRFRLDELEADYTRLTELRSDLQFLDREVQGRDQNLVLVMVVAGLALVLVLFSYLVVMTHRVAGPLYKVAICLEEMKQGKLGQMRPQRRNDLLRDFCADFTATHEAIRAALERDGERVKRVVAACDAAGVDREGALGRGLDALEAHQRARDQVLGGTAPLSG